jgi:AraC family transcriptional regulator of adaptative response/methylated-DNA-[protein]-cysteine methyltransferase
MKQHDPERGEFVTHAASRKKELTDDARWQAVLRRDAAADGAFVYAVRSTGIYCRPSCPSRRPHREHVVFFSLPELAEQAGYRPCKRCRPQEAAAPDPRADSMRRVCRYIEAHFEESPSLDELGAHVGLSPAHLQRTFKRIVGVTPRQYLEAHRVRHLKMRLREGDDVTTALYEAGYGSSSRLYEKAPASLGMTPGIYRRGGKGMSIRYTIVDCPLGRLLVGATGRGICAVSLGDSDAELESALFEDYPAAEIGRDEEGLGEWVSALLDYLDGQRPHIDLPLDVQATAFQCMVWKELQAIPYGATRSYSDVAEAIGHPKAVRAVAHACAKNRVSLVIPCHRVVRKDGHLGGYRWGLDRKRALLAREGISADGEESP